MSGLFPSTVRRPRLQVVANGLPVARVQEVEIASNSHYAADRFSVLIAMGPDPRWTADYWSSQSEVMLDVQAGFVPDGMPEGALKWVSLVQGAVDTIQIDAFFQSVRLQGRDLTATLIAS